MDNNSFLGSPKPGSKSGKKKEKKEAAAAAILSKKSTVRDIRSPIDKFVDAYWLKNIE